MRCGPGTRGRLWRRKSAPPAAAAAPAAAAGAVVGHWWRRSRVQSRRAGKHTGSRQPAAPAASIPGEFRPQGPSKTRSIGASRPDSSWGRGLAAAGPPTAGPRCARRRSGRDRVPPWRLGQPRSRFLTTSLARAAAPARARMVIPFGALSRSALRALRSRPRASLSSWKLISVPSAAAESAVAGAGAVATVVTRPVLSRPRRAESFHRSGMCVMPCPLDCVVTPWIMCLWRNRLKLHCVMTVVLLVRVGSDS